MSKGVVLSVLASVLFAVMYYFTSLLTPLSGLEIFGWRMLLTVPCMTVFMIVSGEWRRVWELLRVLAAKPKLIAGVLVSSALLGVQLWLFMWAPLNGRSLDVSVGYFLLPLTMVLTGRLVWGERLSRLQQLAVFFAGLGVLNELYQAGGFSWATLVVIIGYPVYFVVRKFLKTDHLGGLWLDMALMLPVAWWFVQSGPVGFGGEVDFGVHGFHQLAQLRDALLRGVGPRFCHQCFVEVVRHGCGACQAFTQFVKAATRLRGLTPNNVGPWTQNHSAPTPAARSLHDMAREHMAKKSGASR